MGNPGSFGDLTAEIIEVKHSFWRIFVVKMAQK